MKTNKPNDAVLDGVDESRREFISKLVAATAFATPLIASFSMDGALIGDAEAQATTGYAGYFCDDYNGAISDIVFRFAAQNSDRTVKINGQVTFPDPKTCAVMVARLKLIPASSFISATLTIGSQSAPIKLGDNYFYDSEFDSLDVSNVLRVLNAEDSAVMVHTVEGDVTADLVGMGK